MRLHKAHQAKCNPAAPHSLCKIYGLMHKRDVSLRFPPLLTSRSAERLGAAGPLLQPLLWQHSLLWCCSWACFPSGPTRPEPWVSEHLNGMKESAYTRAAKADIFSVASQVLFDGLMIASCYKCCESHGQGLAKHHYLSNTNMTTLLMSAQTYLFSIADWLPLGYRSTA